MHTLWTTLDTTSTRKAITHQSLKAYLKRSNYSIDHAIISTRASFDAFKLSYISKHCKNLQALELRGIGIIDNSLVTMLPFAHQLQTLSLSKGIEVRVSALERVFKDCHKTLKNISIHNLRGPGGALSYGWELSSLTSVDLKAVDSPILDLVSCFTSMIPKIPTRLTNNRQKRFHGAAPNLKSLTLTNWKFHPPLADMTPWVHLEYLKLVDLGLDSLPSLPPSLKHLHLDGFYHMRHAPSEDGLDLPLLRTLSVQDSLQLTALGLFDILKRSNELGNLTALDLSGRLSDNGSEQYISSQSLLSLGMGRLMIGDKTILAIIELYPNLREVNLEQTRITGVGLKALVSKGIKSINVDHCDDLGEDAVLWARSQGVQVQHNMMRPPQARRYRDLLADR
jgi:F-box/TPR repeat protein Pof3